MKCSDLSKHRAFIWNMRLDFIMNVHVHARFKFIYSESAIFRHIPYIKKVYQTRTKISGTRSLTSVTWVRQDWFCQQLHCTYCFYIIYIFFLKSFDIFKCLHTHYTWLCGHVPYLLHSAKEKCSRSYIVQDKRKESAFVFPNGKLADTCIKVRSRSM